MLGKLIKHEWKSTGKMGGIVLIVMAVVTLLAVVGVVLPLQFVTGNPLATEVDSLVSAMAMMFVIVCSAIYLITVIGLSYAILIYLGIRFYKTMYTDEGYLTQTLPVSAHQLLVSKILVGGIWQMLAGLSIGVSMILLAGFVALTEMGGTEFIQALGTLGSLLGELAEELRVEMGMGAVRVILAAILLALTTPIRAILMLFGGITIGQLSSKYKGVMGILAFFGILMVNGITTYISQMLFTFGGIITTAVKDSYRSNPVTAWESGIVVNLIMCALMYYISHLILTRKLNMD